MTLNYTIEGTGFIL